MDTPCPSQSLAQALAEALSSHGRPIAPDRAERLAVEIEAHGSLQQACAALANDGVDDLLSLLLACQAALDEQACPALRIRRLRREAHDFDARAEPSWREAAEFAGKAAARHARGEGELADGFQCRAAAAEAHAAALEAQAFARRLEAARLEAADTRAGELIAVLQGLAA